MQASAAGLFLSQDVERDIDACVVQALQKAIDAVKPGVRYREVGDIISHHVGQQGFQVVRSYCGHGICDLFHCAPNLPHYAHNKVYTGAMLIISSVTLLPPQELFQPTI